VSEQSDQMRQWLSVVEGVQSDAEGEVVSRRSPLDLWRLSAVKQINDTWFEFRIEVDSEHLRSAQLEALGRRTIVVRANANRMPSLRSETAKTKGRLDFLAMALIFLCNAAVETAPDAIVDDLPAYVWPTWIREEVSA